jgi:hypothetical protein
MKLTREQFDEIGEFYLDDFPIDDGDQDLMFKVFNCLPKYEKGLAIKWGFNDTVFRYNVFLFLCKNQLNMTVDEYYKSNIFNKYLNNSEFIIIDFSKF